MVRLTRLRRGLGAGLALSWVGAAAWAAPAPGFAPLRPAEIAAFKANPRALLTSFKSAGLPLSTAVKNLVLSDISLAALLTALATSTGPGADVANSAQKAAIGAGLAEAAATLAATDPTGAADIQTQVAASKDADLVTAYVAASSSTQTGAISSAAAAAASSAGGGGGGGGGGAGGPVGGVGASGGAGSDAGGGATTASVASQTPAASFGSTSSVTSPSGGTGVSTATSTSPASTTF